MALCVNQSGTWRNTTTLCVNQSGTWRNINLGSIKQSGTWRTYLDKRPPGCCPFSTSCPLGSNIEGGYLICKSSRVAWIVAPSSAEVSTNWHSRNSASTSAQQVSGCTGWFVPTLGQLQNPGYTCRTYWDCKSFTNYWSSTEMDGNRARLMTAIGCSSYASKTDTYLIRAFRCVTY